MPGFNTSVAVLKHKQMPSPHLPLQKLPVLDSADTAVVEPVESPAIARMIRVCKIL